MNDQRNHGPGPRLYRKGDILPQDDRVRKDAPICRGVLDYFPAALFGVAAHSLESDRKHNPGNPTAPNWAREKSTDHFDCILRHLAERNVNPRYHLRALAWRALAALQEYEESQGAAPGASSRFPAEDVKKLAVREYDARDVRVCFGDFAFRQPIGRVMCSPAGFIERGAMVSLSDEPAVRAWPECELGGRGE